MTRALGRERVKVTRKDHTKIVIPFYDAYKLDEGKGPGAYDAYDAFGASIEAAGAVAFDKMGAGHEVDEADDNDRGGDVLLLSPGPDPGRPRLLAPEDLLFRRFRAEIWRRVMMQTTKDQGWNSIPMWSMPNIRGWADSFRLTS